mmetsp:Transcript_61892/g.134458  ORF Transcript_61892/g.134458 Transcript_61892/m.134458 type:complete len:238 (+) Transcript_61892:202-915(+)
MEVVNLQLAVGVDAGGITIKRWHMEGENGCEWSFSHDGLHHGALSGDPLVTLSMVSRGDGGAIGTLSGATRVRRVPWKTFRRWNAWCLGDRCPRGTKVPIVVTGRLGIGCTEKHVASRNEVDVLALRNSHSVGHSDRNGVGPSRTAFALIEYWLHPSWPLLTCIKAARESGRIYEGRFARTLRSVGLGAVGRWAARPRLWMPSMLSKQIRIASGRPAQPLKAVAANARARVGGHVVV